MSSLEILIKTSPGDKLMNSPCDLGEKVALIDSLERKAEFRHEHWMTWLEFLD